jgi:hypothetical protein
LLVWSRDSCCSISRNIHGRRLFTMQLGKTLIGAIIGAALGILLLVVVNFLFHLDAVWLAIPVAILTGLGVRTLVSTSGHASYLRGALTGVLALAAYLFGWWAVAAVAQQRAAAQPKLPVKVASDQAADETDKGAGEMVEPPPPPVQPMLRPSGDALRKAVPPGQNPLDYVWLGVAALIAYELGRGTGAKPGATMEPAASDIPQGTHPDA